MITPENNIPLDDSTRDEAEDQQSQKDIHGNGIETNSESEDLNDEPNLAFLQQAYDAAESSYTLDLDQEKTKQSEDEAD